MKRALLNLLTALSLVLCAAAAGLWTSQMEKALPFAARRSAYHHSR